MWIQISGTYKAFTNLKELFVNTVMTLYFGSTCLRHLCNIQGTGKKKFSSLFLFLLYSICFCHGSIWQNNVQKKSTVCSSRISLSSFFMPFPVQSTKCMFFVLRFPLSQRYLKQMNA